MGCCSIWIADAEVLLSVWINLSKNPADNDLPVLLPPRDSPAFLSSVTSQWSETNQKWWGLLKKDVIYKITLFFNTRYGRFDLRWAHSFDFLLLGVNLSLKNAGDISVVPIFPYFYPLIFSQKFAIVLSPSEAGLTRNDECWRILSNLLESKI